MPRDRPPFGGLEFGRRRCLIGVTALAAVLSAALLPTTVQAQDVAAPRVWRHFPVRPPAPKGAPNVLLIMTDDVGFGASSTFGGPIPTPIFDSLASHGLRYNEFHNTGMCSPTRAALLTGRNHHAVNSGAIENFSRDLDGYTSAIPASASTIARVLHDNGYATGFFGKNHNTPSWERTDAGPFDRWPNGLGFDYFYGFNDAWANQFRPELVENRNQIRPPDQPGYTLDRDLSDHIISWMQTRQADAPGRPFFIYLAPGSPHTPHQAPADWIARFKGKFDQGWDRVREETFARQKALGVIPADAKLTPRPPQLPPWSSLTPVQQKVAARLMEIYAAQLAHFDYQVGRVIDELRREGKLDNTLVIFIQGDNGSDLANFRGDFDDWGSFFGDQPSYESMLPRLDELGGPTSFSAYPAAWGWALDAPFQWGKSIAGFLGGTRAGLVIDWPDRIKDVGTLRSQFHHVIDIAPTIYEAADIQPPAVVDGVKQQPIDGVSMVYTFDHPTEPSRHHEQYFEMMGNVGYYKDGWIAATQPLRMPWDRTSPHVPMPPIASMPWQLFDLNSDYSQSADISAQNPEKLKEMINLFEQAAVKYHVFPLENDVMLLLRPGTRPTLADGRSSFAYYPRDTRYVPAALPPLDGSWTLKAKVSIRSDGASGPIMVEGDRFNGWGLLLKGGQPLFAMRQTDTPEDTSIIAGTDTLSPGEHEIDVAVMRKDPTNRLGATVSLAVDGKAVAQRQIPHAGIVQRAANVGRYNEVPLLDDPAIPEQCQCQTEVVNLELTK